MKVGLALAGVLALAALHGAPAKAASFDCAHATRVDEVAVCRTPALSALDSEMSGLWYAWSRVPMLMGGRGARMDEARAFLAQRARCGRDIACLGAAYRARIVALRREIDRAMQDYARYVTG